MPEFSETAVLDHSGKIHIGLGAIVVLDGYERRWRCRSACVDAIELAITRNMAATIIMFVSFIVLS
jgi:hypothetical protein